MKIENFYDPATFTFTYVVYDENSKDAVIIDPVLDYAPNSASISSHSVDEVLEFVKKNGLNLHYVLETHAHADHLTGSQIIKKEYPHAKVAIGSKITVVQETFKELFNIKDIKTDGSQFDQLLEDGEVIEAGSLKIKTIFTPGHTPACASYLIDDALFTGDAIFMPDMGTGRCDFPKGDAQDLYNSIHEKLYSLPDETRMFVGHDYQPGGREVKCETTIGAQKKENIQLKGNTTENEFVEFRRARDAQLDHPRIILPSIQINIRAGNLPVAEDNGSHYLKFPITGADLLK